jgi:two-component system sensor histidine kinase ResE
VAWLIAVLAVLLAGLLLGVVVVGHRRTRRVLRTHEVATRARHDDEAALLDAIPLPLFAVDGAGMVRMRNTAAAERLPMFRLGDTLERHSASLARIATVADGPVDELLHLGDPPRTWTCRVARLSTQTLIALQDVTDEVDFEEARRTFSGAVSHELRTPLARVLGLAETLALPGDEEDRADLIEQIEAEVDGMRRLIDEMLLLAALDRGRTAVGDGVSDLDAHAERIVKEVAARRIGRGREIVYRGSASAEVAIAPRLLEVVLRNLVDNALLHGGADAVVTVTTLPDVDGCAELVVEDTGRGIEATHLPYVFQRFYRGDAARTGPGSGLGLSLVKNIVETHDGTVTVESAVDRGTVFRVRFPRMQ